jgi:hypothetical protein
VSRPAFQPYRTTPVKLVSLGTVLVLLVWLAVACYALAYLVSH